MITIENLTRMVSATLKTMYIFSNNCNEINVKDVYILNEDTLCCDFYPVSKNSYDIKLELAPIMGCFNSFFRDKHYENVNLLNYAVRAYDENNNEILYALSTKTAAELIGKGGSIEWLASTFFQINTEDFRLAQAKQIISEIENGLREIVTIKLKDQFGDDWWEQSLNNKIGRDVKKIYFNNFGEDCTDGDILIAYTFTLQLKEIVLSYYNLFTKYFQNSAEFQTSMDSLNRLRREEAHNRPIYHLDLKNLQALHEELLSGVLKDLKSLQSVYLTENWRGKIKKIMTEKRYKDVYTDLEISTEIDVGQKLFKIRENKSSLISYLDDTILKLKSVTVPLHKKSTHEELLSYFEDYRVLQKSLFDEYSSLDNERIDIVKNEIKIYDRKMDEFVEKFLLNEK